MKPTQRSLLTAVLFTATAQAPGLAHAAPLALPAPPGVPWVREDSMRGLYQWFHRNAAPMPSPPAEDYVRYAWKELEPQPGIYDFGVIDKDIASARANGQRLAFRVMPACSGAGADVPEYLVTALKNGVWFNAKNLNAPSDTYFPDWNDPYFLDRTARLIEALGKRYDGNPSIAWIEIGSYGNWGEWHTSPYKYPSFQGATAGTDDTKRAIIDMYVNAFPRTRLLMMTDDQTGVKYAMAKSPSIGLRRDSLGMPWFENGLLKDPEKWDAMKDRWKTAPFVTELYGFGTNTPNLASALTLAQKQVLKYHVSAVGNGNVPRWDQMTTDAREALYALGDSAGYDLGVVATATLSTDSAGNAHVDVNASWTNSGSAPAYDPWTVTYVLVASANEAAPIATLGASKIDLRSILPESDAPPVTVNDAFRIPKNLPPGRYGIAMEIHDPAGIRPPMTLAECEPGDKLFTLAAHFYVK